MLVAAKDFNAPSHQDIAVPNLQVIKALQSLDSRGYVKTRFSWQYYYYSLTDEGIHYLREFLHLPESIVPATHKKVDRPAATRSSEQRKSAQCAKTKKIEWGGDRPRGDRDGYRRRDEGKDGASGEFKPEFVSLFEFKNTKIFSVASVVVVLPALRLKLKINPHLNVRYSYNDTIIILPQVTTYARPLY